MKSTAHNFGIAGQPITSPLQDIFDAPAMARDGFTPQYGTASPAKSPKTPTKPAPAGKGSSGNAQGKLQGKTPPSENSQGNPQGKPSPNGNPQLQALIAFCTQYKREISALVLAVCGMVLFLALVSYSPEDRANARVSVGTPQAEESAALASRTAASRTNARSSALQALQQEEYIVKNWLGYVGASLSHFIYNYTVGYAALAFPMLMFLWSAAILRQKYSDKLLLGTALALVGTAILASFAGVLQLVPWMPTMRPEWSGSVGQFIARMLWQVIGTVGAFIVLTVALVGTLFVALDLNIEKTVARFNEEKSRFGAWKTQSTTDFAAHVRQSMNDAPANGISNAASHGTTSEHRIITDEEDPTNDVIADDQLSKAMFGTVTEAPKAMSYIPDNEVLSAKAAKPAQTPSFADADEPARILQRRSGAEEQPLSSIRRDLITKYSDDQTEAASEVLSASAAASAPVAPLAKSLPQTRVNTASPTISISSSQTTIHAPNFAYPSEASITFVEKKNDEGELKDEGLNATLRGIKDEGVERFAARPTIEQVQEHVAITPQAQVAPTLSHDDLLAESRNIRHLTGLMAEQVAGEVAERIAADVAEGVALDVAERIAERTAKQVAEEYADVMMAKITNNVTNSLSETFTDTLSETLTETVLAKMQAQMTERVEEQVTKRLAEERAAHIVSNTASNLEERVSLEQRINAEPRANGDLRINAQANSLNVIAKPLFMPQNDMNEEIDYTPPTLDLLVPQEEIGSVNEAELRENARILQEKLKTFRIEIENLNVTPGPVVTQYEFVPAAGIKVSQIENLSDDIALALKARGIRIIAPVPGRGTVAVEIPNTKATAVRFSSIVATEQFQDAAQRLPLALGKTINGDVYAADLAKMPHLLIAGATGSGKSVGINSIIASLLYKMHPRNLKFVIIDPKKVEMSQYRSLANHFLAVCPDIDEKIITNPQNAVLALKSVVAEMERRYDVLAKVGQRNIVDYNQKVREGRYKDTSEVVHTELPYIVVIVDELADLMMTAARDVEEPICRLAQLARAVGVHLIVATQRPSVDVVTGLIKANFPARIAYQVSSKIDSRTILDTNGAEHLLGNGDMLFTPGGAGKPMRLQNSYLSTDEVERICDHISNQQGYSQPYFLPSVVEKSHKGGASSGADNDRDELFEEAARIIVRHQQCSVSLLQRRMKIGYSRAARIVDQLEEAGIVGPFDGSKGRAILLESEADLDGIL